MKSFISEDNIEQAICNRLSQPEYGWKRIECSPELEDQDEVASTGRANPSECILPEVFLSALRRLNPQIDDEILKNILQDFRKDYSGTDMVDTNYKFYNQIRNGIKVKTRNQHREDFDIVKLIDFDHPERNEFHCVNQMWIKGHFRYRRPDVLLFVNGLPVVFIELKNSTVKIEESYNKNLVSYRKDIPNIFAMNQICVLSNGLQTKLGAWNAGYEFFFEWLRVNNEKAKLRMAEALDQSVSAYASDGMASSEIQPQATYGIHQGKVIDLSKLDVDALRKEINSTPYKALEIDDLRAFIERTLKQLINKNCTRITFSQRYKSIIDRYNAGGSENEDYYEKLLQLIADLKKEQSRTTDMGLEEEELEIFDLLRSDRKLTKEEEQKVILAAKNLYQKLLAEKEKVLVVDWYKDEQPRHQVFALIQTSLNEDLPMSYDRVSFNDKTHLLFNHFVDMAVQGYGWVA